VLRACALALIVMTVGCRAAPEEHPLTDKDLLAVEAVATLEDFHAAAAAADGARYFGHFAADGVFLGTDATERWTVDAFRAYARPHFDAGTGWTYTATERHVDVDPAGAYAWFDELLANAKLGPCRGSGVLRREAGGWKVVQYNLTIPIPNDLATDVAEQIRRHAQGE